MPEIRPYQNRSNPVQPGPMVQVSPDAVGGAEATANAKMAQALGQAGDATAKVGNLIQDRLDRNDISTASTKLFAAQSKLTNTWQDGLKNANPGDPALVPKFMESVDQELGAIRDGITTRAGMEFFDAHAAEKKAHFQTTAYAAAADLAGEKAKLDLQDSVGHASASVASDPGQYQLSLQQAQDQISTYKGTLKAEDYLKLQKFAHSEITQGMLRGRIQLDPMVKGRLPIEAEISRGDFDGILTEDEKYKALGEARQELRGRRVDADLARKEKKDALEASQEVTKREFVRQVAFPHEKAGPLTARAIVNSNLDSGQQEHYLKMLENSLNDSQGANPAFIAAYKAINAPVGSPEHTIVQDQQITDLVGKKDQYGNDVGITPKEANILLDSFHGKKSEQGKMEATLKYNFITNFADPIILNAHPGMEKMDSQRNVRKSQFLYLIEKKIEEQRRLNKPIENLFDDKSPDFLGQEKFIGQYRAPDLDVMLTNWSKTFESGPQPLPAPAPYAPPLDKNPSSPGPASVPAEDRISKIKSLDLQSIQKLNPNDLNPQEREAARIRYNELFRSKK